MASSFPILFGAPSFGDEDRDQWIRVLQLFLQDPFAPHAVTVGGETQVRYGYTVPAGAITGEISGSQIWKYNSYGIRELNEFSQATEFALAEVKAISNRPGALFVWTSLGGYAIASLLYSGVEIAAYSGAITNVFGTAASVNIYKDDNEWFVQNLTGAGISIYMCIISMGAEASDFPYSEIFIGDGSTDEFTLSNTGVTMFRVYVDGVLQEPGVGWSWSITGASDDVLICVSPSPPPGSGEIILIEYENT